METNNEVQLEKFVSVPYVMDALSISRNTFYTMVDEKTFKIYKVRYSSRVKLSQVQQYMDSQD